MDPLSQAALGASLAQSFARDRTRQGSALLIGALSGMAPDLDVFIRSSENPLLFLEYHRQFTHSLAFIPVGALLCATIFYLIMKAVLFCGKRRTSSLSFAQIYLFSFLGFATHGLLDSCTSYGTQLYWPFSDYRVAWNVVSIIDPLFTLPLIAFITLAVWRSNRGFARIGFVYAVMYLSLGVIQYQRAEEVVYRLAEQRGHQVERMHIKPSFANRHVWKLLYEYDGRYYVDAARLLWRAEVIPGTSIQKLDVRRDYPWLPADSQQAKDIERFRWFSDGFLAISPKDRNLIMDVRYSFLPNRINAMWGVEVRRLPSDDDYRHVHVDYEVTRQLGVNTRRQFLEMVF